LEGAYGEERAKKVKKVKTLSAVKATSPEKSFSRKGAAAQGSLFSLLGDAEA